MNLYGSGLLMDDFVDEHVKIFCRTGRCEAIRALNAFIIRIFCLGRTSRKPRRGFLEVSISKAFSSNLEVMNI